MEAYIGKCLDSLLIPEFDQVEVLVVNDGSKDRSSEIAHSYADRYPDSIRVIDKPNGNYGSCINAALPLATGRYVKVLDADDTFDTAAFSEFVRLLPGIDCDAIVTNHVTVSATGESIRETKFDDNVRFNEPIEIEKAREFIINHYVDMHRLAYRKTLFGRIDYKQTEGVSYSDSQWSIIPLANCKTICCLGLKVYRYLLGREGQTMDCNQIAKFLSNFFAVLRDSVTVLNTTSDASVRHYIFIMLLEQLDYVYRNSLANINEENAALWAEFDKWLEINSKELYDEVGQFHYSQLVSSYKVYSDLRKKNFPSNFRIPMYVRALILLKRVLNKC